MKSVLLCYLDRTLGSPSGHQALAYLMRRPTMQRQLSIETRQQQCGDLPATRDFLRRDRSDVALIMVSWREKPEDLIEMLQAARVANPNRKLALIDYCAPTSSPHFDVLPYVDLFIKRQILRDNTAYQQRFAGGYIFTDFLTNQMGYDLKGWHFGSIPRASEMHKIARGWNLGVVPRYRRLLMSRRMPGRWRDRPFALNRRLGLQNGSEPREWYHRYRTLAVEKTIPLENRWHCSDGSRTSTRSYLWELLRSRIVFSPFGWGELCFRDYEAVCCGALLVKPSVEHMHTSPDIFQPGKTYIPVKWDLSDLESVVEHYLSHPEEAEHIVANAQAALISYYDRSGFVHDMKRLLDSLQTKPLVKFSSERLCESALLS